MADYYRQVLKNLGINPGKLPILEMGQRSNQNCPDVSVAKMTHPIMRFEKGELFGIAVHLVGKTDQLYNDGYRDIPINSISVVLILYTQGCYNGQISFVWGGDRDIVERFYRDRKYTLGKDDQGYPTRFQAWIDGTDRCFGLSRPFEWTTISQMEVPPQVLSLLKKMVELDHPILKELGLSK